MPAPARRDQFETLWLGYTENQGHPELRAAIADMHEGIGAEHVIEVVPEEGIFLTLNALLEAGDPCSGDTPKFSIAPGRSRGPRAVSSAFGSSAKRTLAGISISMSWNR